jgi:predicted anti-sigma-YlaC factor YlaD
MAEHLSCQEIVELVTEYLEGTLAPETASLFEEHLNFCDGCEVYLDEMRATIATVGRVDIVEEEMPAETRETLLDAFRHWRGA